MSYDTTGYTNNSKGLVGGCHVFPAFAMGSGRCRVFGLWAMGRRASTSQLEVKHVLRSEHEHHNIVIIMHTHAIKLILSRASIQLSSVHSCFLGQWLSWDNYQLYISLILWLHELQSNFIDFWTPFATTEIGSSHGQDLRGESQQSQSLDVEGLGRNWALLQFNGDWTSKLFETLNSGGDSKTKGGKNMPDVPCSQTLQTVWMVPVVLPMK